METTDHLTEIRRYLRPLRLPPALETDLTDHLACEAEELMASGLSPRMALADVRKRWPPEQLRKMKRQTFYFTKIPRGMYKLALPFAAAVAAGFFLLSPAPKIDLPTQDQDAPRPTAHVQVSPPELSPIVGIDLRERLSSGFGMCKHPFTKKTLLHRGIDLKVPLGTPVVATGKGRVVFAGADGANGISVRLVHTDGYVTVYNHLSRATVERGDAVAAGQPIAESGSSGASTGPHLHYEILKNDEPVDPMTLLAELR